ncbi:MAG: NUDIX domain-containing protein [Nocardioidaceae bacterium]|nr:NUDIX domain-containing protein [Nocardioidaceae bacterium]
MRPAVDHVHRLVRDQRPIDAVGREHRDAVLAWLASTDDVFRRVRPAVPPRHLVSYVVVTDPARSRFWLVDHRLAGRALPPGGHVEVDEDPRAAAARELHEELGLHAAVAPFPVLTTLTTTVGPDPHEDVSLWFVAEVPDDASPTVDATEHDGGRWWSRAEVAAAPPGALDPHFTRFVAALDRAGDGADR